MRDNIGIYRIMVVFVAVVLLVFGIYLGLKVSDKKQSEKEVAITTNSDENSNSDDSVAANVNIYSDNTNKKADIEIVYEDYYTLCKETITSSNVYYGANFDDLKKQEIDKQKSNKTEYEIVEESKERIVFRRQLEQYCPYHFEVKIENSKVVIYNIVSKEVKTVYKDTQIEEKWVRPELVEELNKGITVNSMEELNNLIEDIES